MTADENFTAVRISREALKILKKYAQIHHQTTPRFLENLAGLLICGLCNLESKELTIKDLRQIYRFSSLMVCEDVRRLNAPRKPASVEADLVVSTK